MLTRLIAMSACALCLAIPAAAGASATTNPPKAEGPYGNPPAGAPSTLKARGPYGNPPAGPPSTLKAEGPYGTPPGTRPQSTLKAKGPYGNPPGTRPQSTTPASVHRGGTSPRDVANGWRTAAISEAALLAAAVLGWALLLLPARHRAPRMVT
jgi:hypothetical protein